MAELVLHYISEDGGDVDATMTELRNTSPAIILGVGSATSGISSRA